MSWEVANITLRDGAETKIYELPEDIFLPEDIEVTPDLIGQLVEIGEYRKERYEMLQGYYEGRAVIQNRYKPEEKANNKLVAGYPSYIVDTIQGYFIGKPVEYTVSEEDQDFMDKIQEVFLLNDEQDENSQLAKICGIKGRAYELVYVGEDGQIRFNQLEPDNVVYVYDTKINPEPLLAIRFYKELDVNDLQGEGKLVVRVYTREEEIIYGEGSNGLVEVGKYQHYFGNVPVIEFKNNDEGLGDFERVISLIDAYNKVQSDTANDFEEFTDAFLALHNMIGTTAEDIQKLKKDKVILLGENQGAGWLIKDINDKAVENFKDRLDNDIHKFSKVPNMSDEKFAGNVSGESMKYKLLALDQLVVTKQRKFKKALQERLKLITNILHIKTLSTDFDFKDIEIKFTNNKPINEKELVEMANDLKGITSEITALSKVSQVTGVSANEEKQRLEEEITFQPELPSLVNFDLENDGVEEYNE